METIRGERMAALTSEDAWMGISTSKLLNLMAAGSAIVATANAYTAYIANTSAIGLESNPVYHQAKNGSFDMKTAIATGVVALGAYAAGKFYQSKNL